MWAAFLAAGAAASTVHVAVPAVARSGVVLHGLGLLAAAVVVAGARRHRPRAAAAWYLLAAAQVAFVAGDVVHFSTGDGFPSRGDALHLAAYPVALAGLVLLLRHRHAPGGDRAGLLDAGILAVGAALLSWGVLVEPYASDASLDAAERAVAAVFALDDVLLLAVLVRFSEAWGERQPAFTLLGASLLALLANDVAYGLVELNGRFDHGSWREAGWLAHRVLVGAAALHPGMRELSQPVERPPVRFSRWRLTAIMCAALAAPALVAVHAMRSTTRSVVVAAAGSAVLLLLVVARTADLLARLRLAVASHDAALARERVLREAAVALGRSPDRRAIREVVTRAVDALAAPSDVDVRVVIGEEDAEPPAPPPGVLERLRSQASVRCTTADDLARWAACAPAAGAAEVVVVPLWAKARLVGCLAAARRPGAAVPDGLRDSLETLGAQVSLSLESAAAQRDALRRESEERLAALVQATSDVIAVLDPADGAIRYVSPSIRRVLGFGPDELLGRSLLDCFDPAEREAAAAFVARHRGAGTLSPAHEWRIRRRDGGWSLMEAVMIDLTGDPRVGGIVVNARDVGERKAFEERLRHQAFHDSLTGLANRALFADRVGHALGTRAAREGGASVLFLDLDDFKTVNDSLGHASGDELLTAVARRIRAVVRPADTPARLGGDEFAVLLDPPTDEPEAAEVAGRLLGCLEEPFRLHGIDVRTRATIGVATARGGDADVLLRNADVAMYTAKQRGKGRYAQYEPDMHERAVGRLELLASLERAVHHGEMGLEFQPILDLASGEVAGFEALVRWHRPDGATVAPLDFIPMAEETGLVVELGRTVLAGACDQARRWEDLPGRRDGRTMSVNLSARQLEDASLVGDVTAALAASGLRADHLVLEITESVLVSEVDLALKRLADLKAVGVRLAIDDFGTGYSSLSYLDRLPVDILKVDKSFVARLGHDGELARAIVGLGRTLGLRTVAEGIERPEQAAMLRHLGCDLGQGFLFARPMGAERVAELLGSGAPG